jgi:hypothetical protein
MMQLSFKSLLLALTVPLDTADAHGHLSSPRSRNYYAFTNKKWWDATENDPYPETDPYSLNKGGTAGQCGIVYNRNYDLPKNAKGGLMRPVIQECYNEGSIIELKVLLTANHDGHFEFNACPITWGEIATEDCFKANPLEFVEDMKFNAPQDPNYRSRAYIPAGSGLGEFHYKYKLPSDLLGDLVLIQWVYYTGNTCTMPGYKEYQFPPSFRFETLKPTCELPITGDGSARALSPERVSQIHILDIFFHLLYLSRIILLTATAHTYCKFVLSSGIAPRSESQKIAVSQRLQLQLRPWFALQFHRKNLDIL